MNALQIFNNSQFGEIRTTVIDGEPWFIAKDVCDCLELTNSRKSLQRLDDDEKGVTSSYTLGGKQELSTVQSMEPSLVFMSMQEKCIRKQKHLRGG